MILYLGNNLKPTNATQTTMVLLSKLLKDEGFKVRMVSSKKNQIIRLLSMLWSILQYRNRISFVLIDTYSTRNFYYAVITSRLCSLLKLKYIPILHGGDLPKRLKKSPKLSEKLFSRSYRNIAPSNYLKETFEASGYSVYYIPNVLKLNNYKFLKRGVSVPRLLYVRAFASIYNPEMAIRVLKELKKEYPEATLCMIGPEKDNSFESCENLVESLELENSVIFTGSLSKSEWHKKSESYNVFINTTNVDNMPVSVMEAMALGLPVVSTNVGGIPYIIEDGSTGLLVEKSNVEEMVNAIRKLINDNNLVLKITKNARNHVEQFDWEHVKYLWLNILQ